MAKTTNVFETKRDNKTQQQQQNKRANITPLPKPGIELETYRSAVRCVTSRPARQLSVSIEVKCLTVST